MVKPVKILFRIHAQTYFIFLKKFFLIQNSSSSIRTIIKYDVHASFFLYGTINLLLSLIGTRHFVHSNWIYYFFANLNFCRNWKCRKQKWGWRWDRKSVGWRWDRKSVGWRWGRFLLPKTVFFNISTFQQLYHFCLRHFHFRHFTIDIFTSGIFTFDILTFGQSRKNHFFCINIFVSLINN